LENWENLACCSRSLDDDDDIPYTPDFAAMAQKKLLEIERAIATLSAREKLWLLERIARQLREPNEAELFDMANDPEIQAEITAIDQEFAWR
jgi:hypothetical protein